MRKILIIFLFLYSSMSYAFEDQLFKLAENLLSNVDNKSVAVTDFQRLDGEKTELGRFFAEEISTTIVELSAEKTNVNVIDRLSLENVLTEQKLSSTGLIDPETTKKVGKITGVNLIVTGSIAKLGEQFRVTTKIMDVETAQTLNSYKVDIPVTESLSDLYYRSSGVSITPDKTEKSVTVKLPVSQVIEKKGITFAFQNCLKQADTITCRVLITSDGKDRNVRLGNNSDRTLKASIMDQNANSFLSANLCFNNTCEKQHSIDQLVFADVPVSVVYEFPIDSSTQSIAFFSFVYKHEDSTDKVTFSNISLGD